MTDRELLERYMGLKVLMAEQGRTENIVDAYITCTTEICMRSFADHGLVDRKAREKIKEEIECH